MTSIYLCKQNNGQQANFIFVIFYLGINHGNVILKKKHYSTSFYSVSETAKLVLYIVVITLFVVALNCQSHPCKAPSYMALHRLDW